METHQKDIEEKDPFCQNSRNEADEKSFLKALLAERALKNGNTQLHFAAQNNKLERVPSNTAETAETGKTNLELSAVQPDNF